MIQTENLSKNFGDFLAVDGVNLEVKSGELLALLGPNGAGKTTTMRMLTSVLSPSAGWARVAGFDVVTQAQHVRSSVGILTEQHGLYGRMSAEEYLDFFGQIYRMHADVRRKRTNELLEQYGLAGDAKRKIGEYSKGMRQKLALARALYHNPPVLLMDEPTSAMDPESARLVRNAIHSLRSDNRAIIICTHNLAEAEELAGKIAIIHLGKIIIAGDVQELKNRLLGAPQFEVRLGVTVTDLTDSLPEDVTIIKQGQGWFQFLTHKPAETNPQVIEALVNNNIPVIGLAEIPRSLEKVYLQAVSTVQGNQNSIEMESPMPTGGESLHAG